MNEILCSYSNSGERKVKLLSTRTTTGTWTIEKVEPLVPLYITIKNPNLKTASQSDGIFGVYLHLNIENGGYDYQQNVKMVLGNYSNTERTNCGIIIPTANTISLTVYGFNGVSGTTISALQ